MMMGSSWSLQDIGYSPNIPPSIVRMQFYLKKIFSSSFVFYHSKTVKTSMFDSWSWLVTARKAPRGQSSPDSKYHSSLAGNSLKIAYYYLVCEFYKKLKMMTDDINLRQLFRWKMGRDDDISLRILPAGGSTIQIWANSNLLILRHVKISSPKT